MRVQTDYGAFVTGQVKLPQGRRCPSCRASKLRPRPSYPGVLWCSGCGLSFDGDTREPICPVEGPRALEDGELVAPFVAVVPTPAEVAA